MLPYDLIEPLETYLKFRSRHVDKKSTEALFVNDYGGSLKIRSLNYLITEMALVYAGKRVSPHALRDIWAFEYLQCCPVDFPNLALLYMASEPGQGGGVVWRIEVRAFT